MNIFVLHDDPKIAAEMHCDKHVVKMILESAQMLCTVANHLGFPDIPYKSTHLNHPCTVWARESKQNYIWLLDLFYSLHKEWQYRYNHTRLHKSIEKLAYINFIEVADALPDLGLTPYAQAMPDHYRNKDAVKAYRAYYIGDKAGLLQYTKRNKPEWLQNSERLRNFK